MEWDEGGVDAGNCSFTRKPKASIDAEANVYKSNCGNVLMTLDVDFVKRHLCKTLFPIGDVLVGSLPSTTVPDSGSPAYRKFVSPVSADSDSFDLRFSIPDIRKGISVKVPSASINASTDQHAQFSLFI